MLCYVHVSTYTGTCVCSSRNFRKQVASHIKCQWDNMGHLCGEPLLLCQQLKTGFRVADGKDAKWHQCQKTGQGKGQTAGVGIFFKKNNSYSFTVMLQYFSTRKMLPKWDKWTCWPKTPKFKWNIIFLEKKKWSILETMTLWAVIFFT